MITGANRKRWNRGLKRKIEKGIISEEEAKPKFIRGDSSSSMQEAKKAEEGIVAEEEAKSKRSRMEAIKEGLFSLVEAVKDEGAKNRKKMPATKMVVEDLFSLVSTVKTEEAGRGSKRGEKRKKQRS